MRLPGSWSEPTGPAGSRRSSRPWSSAPVAVHVFELEAVFEATQAEVGVEVEPEPDEAAGSGGLERNDEAQMGPEGESILNLAPFFKSGRGDLSQKFSAYRNLAEGQ